MTTNNTFAALPASEETSDFSGDVYGEPISVGDRARVLSGDYAFLSGKVIGMSHDQAWLQLSVFGMGFTRGFPLTNLVKEG